MQQVSLQQQQQQLLLSQQQSAAQQQQVGQINVNQNDQQLLISNGTGGVSMQNGYLMHNSPGGGSSSSSSVGSNATSQQQIGTPLIEDFKLENNNHAAGETASGQIYRGFIAVIKENFGFIETLSHDEEVFFHFSNYQGNPNWLELGQEVEYTLAPNGNTSVSGNCLPAENVRTLPKNSIPQPAVLETVHNGVVARPLRCINPDQQEYAGLIELHDELRTTVISQHEFGITSLVNKRDLLQKGDLVSFRIDESGRAADVNAVRQKKRATVDSIKGQFGFLNFEVEDGKKLFFHMSEVQGNTVALHPGDTVEFSVVTNQVSGSSYTQKIRFTNRSLLCIQRNGKSSACNVLKINDRPDRLISRLKLNGDDGVPRLILIRAPKGPQGKGFSVLARHPRIPGEYHRWHRNKNM